MVSARNRWVGRAERKNRHRDDFIQDGDERELGRGGDDDRVDGRLGLWRARNGWVSDRALHSACRRAQRRAVNAHRVALVAQATEKSVAKRFVAKEVVPLLVLEIGGDNCRFVAVALFH